MRPAPSPCKKICKLDENKEFCLGCLRTFEEIANWRNLSEEDKWAIWIRCTTDLDIVDKYSS